jgi:putative solute:sodium symporter small subunit
MPARASAFKSVRHVDAREDNAMSDDRSERRRVHWAKTRRLTFWVLFIWVIFSLVAPWYARELDAFTFLGFQLGYYLIVQGSLIVFVLLIVVQNMVQDRIDDAYGSGEL